MPTLPLTNNNNKIVILSITSFEITSKITVIFSLCYFGVQVPCFIFIDDRLHCSFFAFVSYFVIEPFHYLNLVTNIREAPQLSKFAQQVVGERPTFL